MDWRLNTCTVVPDNRLFSSLSITTCMYLPTTKQYLFQWILRPKCSGMEACPVNRQLFAARTCRRILQNRQKAERLALESLGQVHQYTPSRVLHVDFGGKRADLLLRKDRMWTSAAVVPFTTPFCASLRSTTEYVGIAHGERGTSDGPIILSAPQWTYNKPRPYPRHVSAFPTLFTGTIFDTRLFFDLSRPKGPRQPLSATALHYFSRQRPARAREGARTPGAQRNGCDSARSRHYSMPDSTDALFRPDFHHAHPPRQTPDNGHKTSVAFTSRRKTSGQ